MKFFLPIIVKSELKKLQEDGDISDISNFKESARSFYSACFDYLDLWTQQIEEIKFLDWILLKRLINWSEIEAALDSKCMKCNIKINDGDLFDEVSCAKIYVTEDKIKQWEEEDTPVDRKWVEIFDYLKTKNITYTNLLKVVEFGLCLPGTNAPTERVFSLMNILWDTNKTQMKLETLKSLLITKCNYDMSCIEFYEYIQNKDDILKEIQSAKKYDDPDPSLI
jgi:hypothetical protein